MKKRHFIIAILLFIFILIGSVYFVIKRNQTKKIEIAEEPKIEDPIKIEKKEENKEENSNIDSSEEKEESSKKEETTSPSSTPSSSPTVSPTSTPSSNSTTTPTPTSTPNTKTQEEINDEYRKKLQSTYSINIAYKEEMSSYSVSGYGTPTKLYDDDIIYKRLQVMEKALKKYPSGFFQEFQDIKMGITIYLVSSINGGGVSGLTDGKNKSNVVVMLDTSAESGFERAFHHELMHYIDIYLSYSLGSGAVEYSMTSYNPEGFQYGIGSDEYDYNKAGINAYFLSAYSRSNYLEDRAVLFADLMVRYSKKDYMNVGTPIYKKAKLMSEQITSNFNSVSDNVTEYWERFF